MSFIPAVVTCTSSRLILCVCFLIILCHAIYPAPPLPHERLLDTPCKVCKRLTLKFIELYRITEKSSYGGGNTDWEERKLKGYAKSETRLAEITENLCARLDPDCSILFEKYEELIEEWYQNSSLEIIDDFSDWLCINISNVCCPEGTFGKNCRRCHRGDNGLVCSGRGTCDGDGTKLGSGRCDCTAKYAGTDCSNCRNGYTKSVDTNKEILCIDVDECQDNSFMSPCGLKKCNNTDGGFECYGEPFYKDTSKLATIVVLTLTASIFMYNKMHGLVSLVCTTTVILIILYAKHIL